MQIQSYRSNMIRGIDKLQECLISSARCESQNQLNLTDVADIDAIVTQLLDFSEIEKICWSRRIPASLNKSPLPTEFVMQGTNHRVVLVVVNASAPIPVHDHPGSYAVQLLLSGTIKISHYELCKEGQGGLVRLKRNRVSTLQGGDVDYVNKKENIHCVESLTKNAVMLNVQRLSRINAGKSWYFPSMVIGNKGHYWHRVRMDRSKVSEHY